MFPILSKKFFKVLYLFIIGPIISRDMKHNGKCFKIIEIIINQDIPLGYY